MTQTAHLVIILLLVHPPLAEAEQLRFQWALGTISDGGSIPVAVSQDTSLQSGDRLKAMVRPLSAGYIYLIHQDPSGVFASLITARNDSAAHFAPSEDAWFELDAVTGEGEILHSGLGDTSVGPRSSPGGPHRQPIRRISLAGCGQHPRPQEAALEAPQIRDQTRDDRR